MLLAIDPGPVRSAWVEYDGERLTAFSIEQNEAVLDRVSLTCASTIAIEDIVSYGRPVGQSTFATCRWSGRFEQHWRDARDGEFSDITYVSRLQVKLHLCKSGRANDAAVRQALVDRWGGVEGRARAVGTKASPGPLYGVSKDVWQALAVAVTAHEAVLHAAHA